MGRDAGTSSGAAGVPCTDEVKEFAQKEAGTKPFLFRKALFLRPGAGFYPKEDLVLARSACPHRLPGESSLFGAAPVDSRLISLEESRIS